MSSAVEIYAWDHWETADLNQILAQTLFEADCGNLKSLETGRLGPKPGQEPFGARFWQFDAFQPAIEIAFWNLWETAVLGQILAGSRLEPDFGNLALCSRLLKLTSGIFGKRPFEAKSWPGAFWKQI